MIIPIFKAKIEEDKLLIQDREGWREWLSGLNNKAVEVIVRPFRKIRSAGKIGESGNQNGYYWAVIIEILKEFTGHDKNELHDFLKAKFLIERKITIGKSSVNADGSTRLLSTIEFEEYCDKIRMWDLTDFDQPIKIPLPNQVSWDETVDN